MLNPYADVGGQKLFKGDLHLHSSLSDGDCAPEEMFDRLTECGFDFCCLADHDLPGEARSHGDLLVLPGQEMSAETGHIVALSSETVRDESWNTARQLQAIAEAHGFSILSHPRIREFVKDQRPTYTPARLINELAGLFNGIEIYTHNLRSGPRVAIDRLDAIWTWLTTRRDEPEETPLIPVWGFASSDGHWADHITENVGILVWADELSQSSLLDAIARGAFYSLADSKARLSGISVDGERLFARATDAAMMGVVESRGLPAKVVTSESSGDMEIDYPIRGDEGYLRVEAMDSDGHCVYTNPIVP